MTQNWIFLQVIKEHYLLSNLIVRTSICYILTEIVTIDAGDCEHAFVIKNGDVMAKRVADWVSYQSHIVSS